MHLDAYGNTTYMCVYACGVYDETRFSKFDPVTAILRDVRTNERTDGRTER